jgi:hypothetical protein
MYLHYDYFESLQVFVWKASVNNTNLVMALYLLDTFLNFRSIKC